MTYTVSRIVSDETLSRIIQIESAGRPAAKARTSTATGLGQFINSTWLQMVRMHLPELFRGRTEAQVLALRTDPDLSIELLARFAEGNAKILGSGWTDGDLYLAHFAGVGTAQRLKRAASGTLVSAIMSAAAINANVTILSGKTAGEVRAWANRKMAQAGGYDWIARLYNKSKPSRFTEIMDDLNGEVPLEVPGDPEVYGVQEDLKAMGYNPGDLDGDWGGATAGALTAFLNDQPGDVYVEAPTSKAMFRTSYASIRQIIDDAQARNFTRPISLKRQNADIAAVAEKAPEVVPTRQNFFASVWALIVSIVTAIGGAAKQAWEWFTGNRDVLDTGVLGYLGHVPVWVWAFLISGVLVFIVLNARKGVNTITASVQSGERL